MESAGVIHTIIRIICHQQRYDFLTEISEYGVMTLSVTVHFLIIFLVITAKYFGNPFLIFQVPTYRLDDSVGELCLRIPTEFILYLCRINGITGVMTETV